ncbi:MAG: hypothetical protein WC080_02660 [Patescibacteria group bacterium]|jgi:hypothetical protein
MIKNTAQFFGKICASLLVLSLMTIFIPFSKVQAASLPSGGSTIDTAVGIAAGSYTVGRLVENEKHFYSISVKAGQELKVTGTFKVLTENAQYGTLNTIELFSDDKESMVSEFEDAPAPITVAALANSTKSTHTFYIRLSDDTWGTESGTFEVSLTDRFDAGSTTDAGQAITSAMSLNPGTYTGYYSSVDTDDYYAVSAKAGPFSVKLTPDTKAVPTVKVFDSNRTELGYEMAGNAGEIKTVSVDLSSDQVVYVGINCDINSGCETAASEYNMVISATAGAGGTGGDVGGGGTSYPDVVPVVPTGEGANTDAVVTPVIKKVYDDKAKIASQKGRTLIYILGRNVADNDLTAIKAAMEGIGYKTKKFVSNELIVTKGFKQLTFTTAVGSNKISVKSGWVMNWLWAGIIGGAIILIILILIIILATRKKKPTAVPPTPTAANVGPAPAPPTPPKSQS